MVRDGAEDRPLCCLNRSLPRLSAVPLFPLARAHSLTRQYRRCLLQIWVVTHSVTSTINLLVLLWLRFLEAQRAQAESISERYELVSIFRVHILLIILKISLLTPVRPW